MTTESQWKEVAAAAMDLEREYAMRRTMLMTRLNATLQSFTWKDRKLSPEMLDVVSMKVFQGRAFTNVTAADVLAARRDQTILTKVSSVPPATRQDKGSTALTKVKIGQVPDRGGERRHSIPPARLQMGTLPHGIDLFFDVLLQDDPANKKLHHQRCPVGNNDKGNHIISNSSEGVVDITAEEVEATEEVVEGATMVEEVAISRAEVDTSRVVTKVAVAVTTKGAVNAEEEVEVITVTGIQGEVFRVLDGNDDNTTSITDTYRIVIIFSILTSTPKYMRRNKLTNTYLLTCCT